MIASNCVDIDHLKFGKYWFSSRYTIEREKIGLNEIPSPNNREIISLFDAPFAATCNIGTFQFLC